MKAPNVTSGEWCAKPLKNQKNGSVWFAVNTPENQLLFHIGGDRNNPQHEANARLLAQSKRLAEALRFLILASRSSSWAHMTAPPEAAADCKCKSCCIEEASAALLAAGYTEGER